MTTAGEVRACILYVPGQTASLQRESGCATEMQRHCFRHLHAAKETVFFRVVPCAMGITFSEIHKFSLCELTFLRAKYKVFAARRWKLAKELDVDVVKC